MMGVGVRRSELKLFIARSTQVAFSFFFFFFKLIAVGETYIRFCSIFLKRVKKCPRAALSLPLPDVLALSLTLMATSPSLHVPG